MVRKSDLAILLRAFQTLALDEGVLYNTTYKATYVVDIINNQFNV